MTLTIGMAACNNHEEVWFTLQALRLYHNLRGTEILVVDNGDGDKVEQVVQKCRCRYVRYPGPKGTAAPRDEVFRQASGEWVLCIDSHVMIHPGAVAAFRAWAEVYGGADLYHGPMLYDNLVDMADAMNDEWRGHMWGTWRSGLCQQEPYDIPMHGLGLFACRRDAWLWFHPEFRGFGGEEGYIHEKFRRAGRRVVLLPFLRWLHRFKTGEAAPYPCTVEDRVRNYLLGLAELGLDSRPLVDQFGQAAVDKARARI